MSTYRFVAHQPSGDAFAVEEDEVTGEIIRAAGPVPFGERFTDPSDWVTNATEALDDGEWLNNERTSPLQGDQRT